MKSWNRTVRTVTAAALASVIVGITGCGASQESADDQIQAAQPETSGQEEIVQTQQAEPSQEKSQTETTVQEETMSQNETENQEQSIAETEPEEEQQSETETQSTEEPQPTQETQQQESQKIISSADYAVSVKGILVPLKGDMRDYVDALGEPDGYSAARSCMESGEDKVYTYGGVVIYTYVTGGRDMISLIEITGGEALVSGIHIGSTKAEVITAYGNGYTEEGAELLYEMDGMTLGLQIDGDAVSFIELFGR